MATYKITNNCSIILAVDAITLFNQIKLITWIFIE